MFSFCLVHYNYQCELLSYFQILEGKYLIILYFYDKNVSTFARVFETPFFNGGLPTLYPWEDSNKVMEGIGGRHYPPINKAHLFIIY